MKPRLRVFLAIFGLLGGLDTAPTVSAQSSFTWTGGGGNGNWTTGANWGGTAPSNPQAILNFAGTSNLNTNNDLGAFGPGYRIFFNSGAGAFTITGNAINFFDFGGNNPQIENDSTSLQTIQLNQLDVEHNMDFIANTGSLAFSNSIYLDNNSSLNLTANSGQTITINGAINTGNGNGGSGKVTIGSSIGTSTGGGTVIFKGTNSYAGETDIDSGILRVDTAPSSTAIYYVGNGTTGTGTAASLLLGGGTDGLSGGVTFNNPVQVNPGNGTNRTLGGTNTSGTNTFTGSITLDATGNSSVNLTADTGGTVEFSGGISGTGQGVTKIGGGTVLLSAATAYSGTTTVNAGTLNAGATNALGSTNGVALNSGGTLLLSNSGTNDRINNAATMTLNGGTLNTGGLSEHGGAASGPGVTPGIGALTLQASSIIDMGAGNSILAFADSHASTWSAGTTLSIYNWSGTPRTGGGIDELFFGTTNTGLSTAQLGQILFYSDGGTTLYGGGAAILSDGEVVPVPEPSTWIAGILSVSALIYTQRHRFLRTKARLS